MNKKFFLSLAKKNIKKISIWILFFLFFSETSFWISFDKRKDFYENFYSNIYDETEYDKTSLERIANETWLDENFLLNFKNWKATLLSEKCKNNNWIFCEIIKKDKNNIDSYDDILKQKIENEIKLVKLEEKLKSIWEDEEIFSDWDYDNSFFDIVTQWNVIDAIIFWKDWMTPFFKYDEKDYSSDNWEDSENYNFSEKITDEDENEYVNETISYFDENTESESENLLNSIQDGFSKDEITEIKNYQEINEICLDPFSISQDFLSQNIFTKTDTNISELEKIFESNNQINQINWEDTKSEIETSVYLENNETTEYWFLQPKDSWEECKKPLYWWYICLDNMSKWNCYEIWKDWENWSFCREILFIKDSQELLWNWSSANCINCYISKWLQIIEDELYWEALYPRKNGIKNWNLPNMSWLKRDYSFLSISKKPMPWEKENYKKNEVINLTWEELFDWKFKNDIQQAEWDYVKLEENAEKNNQASIEYSNSDKTKTEAKQKVAVIKDAYFWDVNWRITEFRNLFQTWILNNIEWMPFEEIEKISKKSCEEVNSNIK